MSEDTDDPTELDYLSDFQDVVSQRAIAFCNLARLADSVKDAAVKELCLAMMRKVSASVKSPSTAEVRMLTGGQSDAVKQDRLSTAPNQPDRTQT
jgi:hypothetical protein